MRVYGNTVGGQRRNDRTVLTRHRLHRCHELQVLALRIVHQRYSGLGHSSKPRDFSWVVHPHFNNGNLMARVQTQQRQRHANVVVEVALSSQHRLGPVGAQHRCDHLRHRGLSIASSHGNQGQIELRSPAACQRAQSNARVLNDQPRQSRVLQALLRLADDREGAFVFRLR